MKKYLLLTALLGLNGTLFAQSPHPCAVDSLILFFTDYQAKTNAFAAELAEFRDHPPAYHRFLPNGIEPVGPTAGCQDAVYVIPVVVHIDTSGGTVQVSDTQVYQQMAILNDAFATYGIRFVLAKKKPGGTSFSGINRFSGSFDYRFHLLDDSYASSSAHYFDPEKYFNIYITPQILASDGSLSSINGFNNVFADWNSNFPDMIVLLHSQFGHYTTCANCGTLNSNSRGLTLVHEAGHYLGLRELWQGGCGTGDNAGTCNLEGDLCCDTRPVNANYTCPVPGGNDCSYHLSIADNHENYMDYTGQDCQDNFTPDQVSLMYATLELYRNTLISPQNLNLLDLDDCFATALLDAESNFSCDSAIFTLHAVNYNNATGYRWIIKQGTQTLLDTTLTAHTLNWQKAAVPFGKYDVTLEITYDSTDIAKVTRFAYLEVADCGSLLASEQGHWYFGDHSGLRFIQQGGPVRDIKISDLKPNNINTFEGTISHSDSSGNLLFYGGGTLNFGEFEVYNRNYQPMPNSPIIGDVSAYQSGAVVKVPGQTGKYYLFTVGGNDAGNVRGFRYSVIDMSLDGGNGDIVSASKNTPVKGSVNSEHVPYDSAVKCGEQITVIPGCSSGAYWILVTDNSDTAYSNANKILVFSLDQSGISFHGSSTERLPFDDQGQTLFGFLKASPDGNWVFCRGQVFRFDKSNGTLTLYRDLEQGTARRAASFSPNSRLLYVAEPDSAGSSISNLYQYDLQSSNDTLSKTFITTYPYDNDFITLQLGPDGKIYMSRYGNSRLAEISKPDSNVSQSQPNACGYTINGPALAHLGKGGICAIGLPNMRDAKLPEDIGLDFLAVDSNCGTLSFYPNTPCQLSYLWYFGDGDSSVQENTIHTYPDTGTYLVTLIVNGTDTIQKSIYIGIQSRISGSFIACVQQGTLAGYSVANRNPEYQYTWDVFGGSIASVDVLDNLNVSWDNSGYVTLLAVNPLNGCQAMDTLEVTVNRIDSNVISAETPCFSLDPLFIDGNEVTPGSIEYQWQYSHNGSDWSAVSGIDTLEDLETDYADTILWYRRLAFDTVCIWGSNAIQVTPPVSIQGDSLRPLSVCGASGDVYSVPLNLTNASFHDVVLEFNHYKEVSPSIYDWVTERQDYPYDFSTLLKRGDSVKYEIIVQGCDSVYSNTAPIRDFYRAYAHPYDCLNIKVGNSLINIPEGTNTFLFAVLDTANQWLLESSNADSFFKWEKYVDGDYVEVPGGHNDTLFLNASRCSAGQYRVSFKSTFSYLGEPCMWMSSCSDSTVTVSYSSDLWSRDSQADTGAEPNALSAGDYWKSPDLWNNVDPLSYSSLHQNPEYKSTSPNRIHLRVRNRGTSYSANAKVFLYWTLPSTNEYWPLHWTYDSTNNFFFNGFHNDSYPLGSEINDTGIWVGPLAPGTDTIVSYDWYPPNPDWYFYFDTGGVMHNFNGAMLCLLARIVECEESAPYGMSYPEVIETTDNVKYNNNIVTRNTILVDDPLIDGPFPGYFISYPIVVGPSTDTSSPAIAVGLQSLVNEGYFTYGKVFVTLDDTLYDAWTAGGNEGEGFLMEGKVFRVTDPLDFKIENILLETPYRGIIEVTLQIDSLPDMTPIQFEFLMTQYSGLSSEADGGVYIQGILPVQPPEPMIKTLRTDLDTENDSAFGNNPTIIENNTQHTEFGKEVYAYPNPFTEEVNFAINLEEQTPVTIVLYNSLGARVAEISPGTLVAGKHLIIYNGASLAPGAYHALISLGNEQVMLRVVVIR